MVVRSPWLNCIQSSPLCSVCGGSLPVRRLPRYPLATSIVNNTVTAVDARRTRSTYPSDWYVELKYGIKVQRTRRFSQQNMDPRLRELVSCSHLRNLESFV